MSFSPTELNLYAKKIKDGEIGIIPCDTIWGIVSNYTIENYRQLCTLKQRSFEKPFLFLISSWNQLTMLSPSKATSRQEALLTSIWPGPTTVILPKSPSIPDAITGGKQTIAIRYPDVLPIQWLINAIGHPILSTSINISDTPYSEDLKSIPPAIKNGIDFIWEPFTPHYQTPSKILDATTPTPRILRS